MFCEKKGRCQKLLLSMAMATSMVMSECCKQQCDFLPRGQEGQRLQRQPRSPSCSRACSASIMNEAAGFEPRPFRLSGSFERGSVKHGFPAACLRTETDSVPRTQIPSAAGCPVRALHGNDSLAFADPAGSDSSVRLCWLREYAHRLPAHGPRNTQKPVRLGD